MAHVMADRAFDIVVVGSCVQDLTSYCDRFPRPGESVRGSRFQTNCGGKGANQAVAAALLGAKVAFVGRVGDDAFGLPTVENMRRRGIDVRYLQVTQGASTGSANIFVESSAENCIIVVLGANEDVTVADVSSAEEVIKSARVVIVQLEIPMESSTRALELGRKHGVFTIFNPAPSMDNIPDKIVSLADIVVPNENEAEFITGKMAIPDDVDSQETVLNILLGKGCRNAMITLGACGCVLKQKGQKSLHRISGLKVDCIDTVGAGDCFIGSLSYFIACHPGLALSDAVRRANFIAARSTTRRGTQSSYHTRDELTKLDAEIFVPYIRTKSL